MPFPIIAPSITLQRCTGALRNDHGGSARIAPYVRRVEKDMWLCAKVVIGLVLSATENLRGVVALAVLIDDRDHGIGRTYVTPDRSNSANVQCAGAAQMFSA
jgi:hypothetical protein